MSNRPTERPVAEAAPLETARRAAGVRGAGSHDPIVSELRRPAVEPGPRLETVAAGIDVMRRELQV